ncbi:OmpA family protein [Novosphingobium sp. 9U]|uniref:OmpA family protein n=1 Tax=Novosphingobium sp. 9U TaxID=2653158 RepID=UPI0012F03A67|nr:OmpA family protein [Novosphingobium sp. 9U]VWX52791.1 conserved hypothetical protein [Novosphingobium sp. 9U]
MRVVACAALCLVLGACSGEREPEGTQADAPAVASQAATAPSDVSAPARSGPGLVGQVSSLKSAVSGLNVRVTDMGTIIDLPTDALFAFDSAELNPAATEQLKASAQLILAAPAGPIKVIGHTDSKGDDAYNQKLSEARARAVVAWFSGEVGVRQRSFEASGKGETAPIAPNETLTGKDDPAGRARNRRVEVVLPK